MLLVIVYLVLMVEYCVALAGTGTHNYTVRQNPEYRGWSAAGAGVTLGSGTQLLHGRNLLGSRVTLERLPPTTLASCGSKMRNSTSGSKTSHASIFAKFRKYQACAAVLLRGTSDVPGDLLRKAPAFKRDLQACVGQGSTGADEAASLYKFADYLGLHPGSLEECRIGSLAEPLSRLDSQLSQDSSLTRDRNVSASSSDTPPVSPLAARLLSYSLSNCSYFASIYPLWK